MWKKTVVTIGEFSVTPFSVPHDSADNVGYRIEHDGVVFCLVTDAGEVTSDIKKGIAEADYLVIEANHDVQMLEAGKYPPYEEPHTERHRPPQQRGVWQGFGRKPNGQTQARVALPSQRGEQPPRTGKENGGGHALRNGIKTGESLKLEVLKRKSPSEIYELV